MWFFIAKIAIFDSLGATILLKYENLRVLLSCSVALYMWIAHVHKRMKFL